MLWNQHCLPRLFIISFSLGLLFEPEDGSNTFLRIVGGLLPNYTALQPRKSYSSQQWILGPYKRWRISLPADWQVLKKSPTHRFILRKTPKEYILWKYFTALWRFLYRQRINILHVQQNVFNIVAFCVVRPYCHVSGVPWRIITDSGLDDCIYWHLYYNYN
jgi:hypothetical protein